MPKLTLQEKRRELLRTQLYGKHRVVEKIKHPSTTASTRDTYKFNQTNSTPESRSALSVDSSFMKRDLTKILTLSMLALGAQILLLILSKSHLIHLGF